VAMVSVGRLMLATVVVGLVATVGWRGAMILNMGCGGSAKIVCSSVFLQGRGLDEIRRHELSLMPAFLFNVEVGDCEVVASSLFGLFSRRAVFGGPLLGCALNDPHTDSTAHMDRLVRLQFEVEEREEEWPMGYGMDEEKVARAREAFDMDQLRQFIHKEFTNESLNTRGIVVSYDGQIVHEEYGSSEDVGNFDENTPQLGWSMTKSLLSTLIGMRIAEGKLSMDDHVSWKNKNHDHTITVRDLLQMSSGLEFLETYGLVNDPAVMLFIEKDTAAYASSKTHLHPPGHHWSYSSGSSNILSRKLKETFDSEEEYLRYPREALFERLGMDSALMEVDPVGQYIGSSFSYATARDWCKYGLLYLNDGKWPYGAEEQSQIISKSWVKDTATPAPASHGLYGLHWWLGGAKTDPSTLPEKFHWLLSLPEGSFLCSGYDDQLVLVVPSHKLVIVRLGWTPKSRGWSGAPFFKGIADAMK